MTSKQRKIRAWGAALALCGASLGFCAGCDDSLAKDFRGAAAGELQTGLNSILQGLVTGAFAVLDPEEPSATDGDGSNTATP